MIYICKCGKNFSKSSNAATTGFRDTDTCRGCPHLLPYGENYFDDVQQAFVLDIKGYECRASQFLRYQTELSGALDDKTTIRIESLDFDFLERVSNWVKDHYPDGELFGSFSRENIRSAEYTSNGRYRYTLSCSQNKKGIAAKRALWAEFFDETYHRTDMSAEEEKDKVLKDIQLGIERAKEAVLMHYKDENTGWVYRVSPQPAERELYFIEYLDPSSSVIFKRLPDYPGSRFRESVEEALTVLAQRNGWTPTAPLEIDPAGSDLSDVEEEKATERHGTITPEGEFFADGAPCRKSVPFRAQIDAGQAQAIHVCNEQPSNIKIWLNEFSRPETWVMNKKGMVCGEFIDVCPYCHANLKEGRGDVLFVPRRPLEKEDNTCPSQSAPTGDAAVTTTENAVKLLAGAEETLTTSESAADASTLTGLNEKEIPEMSAAIAAAVKPAASPAPLASDSMTEATAAGDCVATENVDGVTAVSLSPDGNDIDIPAEFDYSGLDAQTVADLHLAEREFAAGKRLAEMGLRRMAEGVAIAHDALCGELSQLGTTQKHGNRGEDTFKRWCESIGVSRSSAYRMLNVVNLFDESTPRQQKVLDVLAPSVLYEASRPSAEPQAVEALRNGEITTLKQYKELEAQLKETQERAERAEQEAQEAKEKAHRLETRPVMSELYDANRRIKELENRPIEVATQAPTEEQINEAAKPVIQEMTAMYKVQQEQQREQIRELKAIVAASRNAIPNACRAIAESCAAAFASGFEEFQAMAQDLSDDEYMNAVEPIFEACREILDSLEGADYVEG